MSKQEDHNMNYTSGMMTSWNKFCFTGGLIVANVSLPGANDVAGLWPAMWTMGNLGRAGYGASLEGMVRFPVILPIDRRAFNFHNDSGRIHLIHAM